MPFRDLFPQPHPLIGMIALPPMPGYAGFRSMAILRERVLADLQALEAGGMHGVLLENDFDQPHTLKGAPEVVAAMTHLTGLVVQHARVPVGVQVLLNDWRASLGIAAATGAQFIRTDFFVDRVRIAAGLIEPEAGPMLAFRSALHAEQVCILADIQVKYSRPADGLKPVALSAHQAADAGADAIVVTGPATGSGPVLDDLVAARTAGMPLLIGSGLTPENAPYLLAHAHGAIVGTSLRSGPGPHDPVDAERVRAVVAMACRSVSFGR